jgi:hypothetical protein
MDANRRAELIFEVAERHQMTTLEVVRMVRLVCYGPEGARKFEECGVYDPIEELDLQSYRDQKRLKERPTIPELLEIWERSHDVCAALAERQTDLVKRAAWFAQLVECETQMSALRERLAQSLPEQADNGQATTHADD